MVSCLLRPSLRSTLGAPARLALFSFAALTISPAAADSWQSRDGLIASEFMSAPRPWIFQ